MNSIETWSAPRTAVHPVAESNVTKGTHGRVLYLADGSKRPVIKVQTNGDEPRERLSEYREHDIAVESLRPFAQEMSLERDGVVLLEQPTLVRDLYDEEAVTRTYYPETEALVKAQTGARRVVIFDHTRRVEGDPALEGKAKRRPVRTVHNDYTDRSGPQRVRDLMGEEAEALLAGRFAIVNTWRPIRGPVLRAPLGFIHPDSIAPEEIVAADLVYEDRVGEIYEVLHNPAHRWLYVPEMESDEVLVFKCYDSARDGRARFLPHTGFDDLATPARARSRESIETRSLVFF